MKKRPAETPRRGGDLLAALLSNVARLPEHGRVVHPRITPPPVPVQRLLDDHAVLADSLADPIEWDVGTETGEELVYLRHGLSPQTLRKLRRGHWVVQDELDLHGCTSIEARECLALFLRECVRQGARCVRVVHGKGLRSKNREPVLRNKISKWLMQKDEVLAFCQARQADGGSGAVLVLLKSGFRN